MYIYGSILGNISLIDIANYVYKLSLEGNFGLTTKDFTNLKYVVDLSLLDPCCMQR